MLVLFILFSLSLLPLCEAPQRLADPVPDHTLVYVQVLIRHGMRTPLQQLIPREDVGTWDCNLANLSTARTVSAPSRRYRLYHQHLDPRYVDYPPSCRPGDLTWEGMDQHIRLGQVYRDHYVSLLPPRLDPSFLSIASSPVDRVLRSAEAFLLGLYPPQNPNELLIIETATEATSDLRIAGSVCPALAAARDEFGNSEAAANFAAENYPVMKEALDALGFDGSWASLSTFSQWVIAFNCSQTAKTPPWLTDEVMAVSQRAQAFDQYDTYANASRGFYASYLLRHLLRDADAQLGNSNGKKFALFGSHDTSLSAVLEALGFSDVHIPLYASHLAFEYWRDQDGGIWIRVVFNGDPVEIDLFGADFVRFDEFSTVMRPFLTACPEVNNWEMQ
jgi:acid phosphatase